MAPTRTVGAPASPAGPQNANQGTAGTSAPSAVRSGLPRPTPPVPAAPTGDGPATPQSPPSAPAPSTANQAQVEVSDHGTVTLNAANVEISGLLELLALRTRRNIVASDKVVGTVSVNLFDVPFQQALDAILAVNSLVAQTEGSFTYIYTRAEYDALEAARKPKESRVFVLQYLSADDAGELIKPLLSADGKVGARGISEKGFQPTIDGGQGDNYAFTAKLVVNDYVDNLVKVGQFLEQLDVAPQQVRVECTVLSAAVKEENAYGLDFAAIGDLNFANLATAGIPPLDVPTAMREGDIAQSTAQSVALSPFPGSESDPNIKVGIMAGDVAFFLRVLDEVTDTTVLARPATTCLNRQRSSVLVGERVAYLSTTINQEISTQTVEYLDTGISLVFRPFIAPDGMIRLELAPSVSDYTLRKVDTPGGGSTTVPDEGTQELQTNVRVRSGQTVVLGGLFKDKMTTKRRQVPVLGDIPLFGAALNGQQDVVERDEIIFLVTPTILEDQKLWDEGRDSLNVVESVRLGARAGLLPFSREQVTSDADRDAYEAYANGDMTKALYFANNSIRMKPQSPEMRRLREQIINAPGAPSQQAFEQSLMGARTFSPSASIDTKGAPQ
jgi:type IV pilus assembly protein PilQ